MVTFFYFLLFSGPLSVDHVDDEAEVDVEQCSDSEALSRSRTPRTTASNNSRATPTSEEERLTPEPVKLDMKIHENLCEKITFECLQSRPQISGSCNSEDLRPIQCHLETKELWDKFHDLGTEMIITKTGR